MVTNIYLNIFCGFISTDNRKEGWQGSLVDDIWQGMTGKVSLTGIGRGSKGRNEMINYQFHIIIYIYIYIYIFIYIFIYIYIYIYIYANHMYNCIL